MSNGKTVVLNFRATRCPTCTEVSNDMIAKQASLPADVVVLEVDYDIYTDLKEQY
jgi:thiol-disulfide isomerase/thioredoxin